MTITKKTTIIEDIHVILAQLGRAKVKTTTGEGIQKRAPQESGMKTGDQEESTCMRIIKMDHLRQNMTTIDVTLVQGTTIVTTYLPVNSTNETIGRKKMT